MPPSLRRACLLTANSDGHRPQLLPRNLVLERDVQAGGEGDVVAFDGRVGGQGMIIKYVSEIQLPSQPVV